VQNSCKDVILRELVVFLHKKHTGLKDKIQQYHEELLAFLQMQHAKDSNFRFRVRERRNPNLLDGFWFVGNDEYLETSFWNGNDRLNKTCAIRLVFNVQSESWALELVGRDDKPRLIYFKEMAQHLGELHLIKPDILHKYLSDNLGSSWLTPLEHFILKEKESIDEYLKSHPFQWPNKGKVGRQSKNDQSLDNENIDNEKDWVITESKFLKNLSMVHDYQANFREHQRLEAINGKSPKNDCALSRIAISNFQGIDNLEIADLPLDTKWIFLTGENGFGKTSLLRAIAKGLVGEEPFVNPLPRDAAIFLNALRHKKAFRRLPNENDKSNGETTFPMAAYGVSRFQTTLLSQNASDRVLQSSYSLFHDDGILHNIERRLIDAERDDKPLFKELKRVLMDVVPVLRDIKSEVKKPKKERRINWYEKDENGKPYKTPVTLGDLAAGYRNILTLVGDMIIRLSHGKIKADQISGIVLIDELDAHLHPKYQYELPNLLSKIFPKIQFIVTTHSPIPMLGLPADNKPVILKVARDANNGIQVERLDDDFDVRKLHPEALLTSPVFDFQNLFARDATPDEVIPSSNFSEIEAVEKLKANIANLRKEGIIQ
jgi:hypothetical protein